MQHRAGLNKVNDVAHAKVRCELRAPRLGIWVSRCWSAGWLGLCRSHQQSEYIRVTGIGDPLACQ